MTGHATTTTPDSARLRSDRLARCLREMEVDGLDALILGDEANARYVSGAQRLWLGGTRPFVPSCIVVADGPGIYLMATSAEGIPDDIPHDHLFGAPWNPAGFAVALAKIPGLGQARRIGIDSMSVSMAPVIASAVPTAEFVDATRCLERARLIKTPDELDCIRTATAAAEAGLSHAVDHLRPGMSERDVFGYFVARLADFGITISTVQGGFWVLDRPDPPDAATDGSVAGTCGDTSSGFRGRSTDRAIKGGDHLVCDVGVSYAGYEGSLGRTWWCPTSTQANPVSAPSELFERWRSLMDDLIDACRPGRPAGDVAKAYRGSAFGLPAIPILSGVGLGMESPLVGDGIPADAGANCVLAPGMVVAIQARVGLDGTGEYWGKDVVLVTDNGPLRLTNHPYGPFAGGA